MTDTTKDKETSSEALAIVRPNVLPSTAQFAMMRELASRLAYAQGFLPDHFFQGPPETRPHRILAAIEYGRAVGIEPMIALQNITMIQGKAGASALLIGALIRRGGYEITDETNDERSVVTITKNGKVSGRGEFSFEDAKRAGLVRAGGGWEKYRRDMLYARALTQAARRGAQDAMLGMAYTVDELLSPETDINEDGQVTGEIPTAQASPETVSALKQAEGGGKGVAAATASGNPAVSSQPASALAEVNSDGGQAAPASEGAQASLPQQGAQVVTTMTPSQESKATTAIQPAPPVAVANKGPRAKRQNVIAAPKAQAVAVAASAPQASANEEGKEAYLETVRQAAREAAATLHLLNVKRKNRKGALQAGFVTLTEPPSTPNEDSDAALARFIANAHETGEFGEINAPLLEELDPESLGLINFKLDELIAGLRAQK